MRKLFSTILTIALVGGTVWAQQRTGDRTGDRASDQDQKFVTEASASGLAEVNLSNLALKMASRREVKEFAQRMIVDHTKANEELLSVVNKKGMRASLNMPMTHRALAERLSRLTGEDFDRTYMQQMLKDHEDAVKLFESESRSGQDADLKALASKTLPTLKMHLEMARKLTGNKGSGDKGSSDKSSGEKRPGDR